MINKIAQQGDYIMKKHPHNKDNRTVSIKRPKTEEQKVWLALKGYQPSQFFPFWFKYIDDNPKII